MANAGEGPYRGSCFCGEVQFEVSGNPAAMGYCHCSSCRHWSAGPVNAFTLWPLPALKITGGASSVGTYNKTPISYRNWCTKCGGHVFTEHPTLGLVDVYAATLPQLVFEPALHVHYQETVLRIPDGKPKMKDMPAEMGGSGVMLPE
ncbi:GFA family protein [Povalibacter sp.]|uniref:GFA family protein n=1 Tax=Povalibacter sp. TaxID=1962978 RepID=UPI002F401B34